MTTHLSFPEPMHPMRKIMTVMYTARVSAEPMRNSKMGAGTGRICYNNGKNKDGEAIPFKHKSRLYAKEITKKDSNGARRLKMRIYQKQMVYYSEKYAKKQRHEREKAVAKARDLIKNPASYTKATSYGCTVYINNVSFSKDTGEIVNGKELTINEQKLPKKRSMMAITPLSQVKKSFLTMKSVTYIKGYGK